MTEQEKMDLIDLKIQEFKNDIRDEMDFDRWLENSREELNDYINCGEIVTCV